MTASLLDRLLDPLAASFSEKQAEQVLGWRPDADLQERIDFLRAAANEGRLTPDEEAEYKLLVEDLDMIAIIQAKARQTCSR